MTSDPRSFALPAPRFVGRDAELATLADALAHRPVVVLVEGEAGVGKTRLIQESLASPGTAPDGLIASCPPFREPYTLGPIVDAIRPVVTDLRGLPLSPLAGALRPLFPEWASELPEPPEPAEDATASRHRLFRALVELLDHLRLDLLVVEDVHWADEATLEFLLFLITPPLRRSLVLTYRPDDVPDESLLRRLSSRLPGGTTGVRLAMEPLDVAATEALIASMLSGAQVSDGFAAFLHARTEGLPLAVEESVRLMYDRADLTRRDGTWVRRRLGNIVVPPTVRDAVLERFARLGPDARAVLQAAAVLSDPADEATLLAVADRSDQAGAAGLVEAVQRGLLRDDGLGGLAFRHVLACVAIHDAIPAPHRRALHARAGAALQGITPPPLLRLARHFRNAGDLANWARYAEQAADGALAAGDDTAAATILHELITVPTLPDATVARLARILPMNSLGRPERLRSLIEALRARLPDGPAATDPAGPAPAGSGSVDAAPAQLRFQLARALWITGDHEAAQPELIRVVDELPPESAERARAMMFLGVPLGVVQPAGEHLRWLREAEALLSGLPSADRLRLQVDRVTALLLLGEPEGWTAAEQLPDAPATAPERRELIVGHGNLGELAMWWGRYPAARQRASISLELSTKFRYQTMRDSNLVTLAQLDWLTGRWDGLVERLTGYADDERQRPAIRSTAALVLGLRHAAVGERADAERRLQASYVAGRESGAINWSTTPAAALARLRLSDGRLDDALAITAEPAEIAIGRGIWVFGADVIPVRVEALLAADRAGEARELVAAYAELVGQHDAPAPQAALAWCAARLTSDHEQAADRFDQLARTELTLPRPYAAGLAREQQGDRLLAAARVADGCAVLTDAFAELSELGARAAALRVMTTLRRHGVEVRRPWWGGSRGYGDQLSPRELDVVRLLVDGRTNRQIAEALVLSPKTVARHVDSAMRKTGVRSRTALAARVVEDGLGAPSGRS